MMIGPVLDAWAWPYGATSSKAFTSISVNGAKGASIDSETRPKNMHVIFIMKVC